MTNVLRLVLTLSLVVCLAVPAVAQQASPQADVYHLQFIKAVPGQAEALAKALMTPDPQSPMPDHFILLRHQQGDDWDFCIIQHLGSTATVDAKPSPAPPAAGVSAWHTDSFVAGPSWAEFAKSTGLGQGSAGSAGSVYSVAVFRAAPGRRDDLGKLLRNPEPSKVPVSRVVLQHLEGGPWQFVAIDRWNSWQDFATDHSAGITGGVSQSDSWSKMRELSSFHRDTVADRIATK